MARFLRDRFYLLAAVFGLTFSAGLVFAQAAPSVVPVGISPVSAAPGGLQTMATYQASGAGAANGYYSRPVLVSNNTLGGLAKGMLRRSVPVAGMVAAVAAAGWVIDELSGQVLSGPPVPTSVPPGGTYYVDSLQGKSHPSAMASAQFMASNYSGFYVIDPLVNCQPPNASGAYACQARLGQHSNPNNFLFPGNFVRINNTSDPINLTGPISQPVPVSDAQLGQLVKDSPQLWNEALRNPDGSVNRNPDVMAEADRLRDALTSPDPVTNPTPNPEAEWDTGQQGGDPQAGGAADLPEFCGWASIVCQLADYLMDDGDDSEDQAPVEIVPDLSVSWSSGFGGGSCPAPVQFEVMGGDVVIPFDFLCELAVYIRPVVLAGAALMALMIVGGFRRAS